MTPVTIERSAYGAKRLRLLLAGCVCLLGFYYIWPYALHDPTVSAIRSDSLQYHLVEIERFANNSFAIFIRDYQSAQLPLYPITFGLAKRYLALDLAGLRALSLMVALLDAGLLYLLMRQRYQTSERTYAWFAALAFLASPFTRASAVWLGTDNLPYLFTMIALLLMERQRQDPTRARIPIIALLCMAPFYTRQYYAWVPIFGLAGLMETARDGRDRYLALISFAAASLPAIAMFIHWGGITNPTWRDVIETSPVNPSSLAVSLSLLLLYGAPIIWSWWRSPGRRLPGRGFPWFCALVGIAVFVGLEVLAGQLPASGGGMIAKALARLPWGVGSHVFNMLAGLGAAALVPIVLERPSSNVALAAAVAAYLPTNLVYQRYLDPLIMIVGFGCLRRRDGSALVEARTAPFYVLLELAIFAVSFGYYSPS